MEKFKKLARKYAWHIAGAAVAAVGSYIDNRKNELDMEKMKTSLKDEITKDILKKIKEENN